MAEDIFQGVRRRLHVRSIEVAGFLREDGLFELEARLVDVKDQDYPIASGLRPAGEPIHDLGIRVVIDAGYSIVGAMACSSSVPYPGACEAIAPAYGQLVGLNLLEGFRKAVGEMFANVRGCSHLTELLLSLPTAAIQTLATLRRDTDDADGKPFQLDRCHALETTSQTVAAYYPRWFRRRPE